LAVDVKRRQLDHPPERICPDTPVAWREDMESKASKIDDKNELLLDKPKQANALKPRF